MSVEQRRAIAKSAGVKVENDLAGLRDAENAVPYPNAQPMSWHLKFRNSKTYLRPIGSTAGAAAARLHRKEKNVALAVEVAATLEVESLYCLEVRMEMDHTYHL